MVDRSEYELKLKKTFQQAQKEPEIPSAKIALGY